MNLFRFAALPALSILLAAPSLAVAPDAWHQGPATAAVPVAAVEKLSLAPPEGFREASADSASMREVSLLPEAIPGGQKPKPRPSKFLPSKKEKNNPATRLAEIAPAAGGPEFSSASSSDLGQVDAFVDKIMSYHLPAGAKPKARASAALTLEDLLSGAGLALNSFVPVENAGSGVILQWTAGAVNGLYERTASTGDFSGQVIGYIARYRENCGQGMDIHVSPAKAFKAGTTATVDIACAKPANSYAASFVFLEDGNGFSTILHTALPAEKEKVRGIRDAIAQKLNAAKEFAAPQAIGQDMAASPLRLKIPSAPASPDFTGVTDGLATVIIQ